MVYLYHAAKSPSYVETTIFIMPRLAHIPESYIHSREKKMRFIMLSSISLILEYHCQYNPIELIWGQVKTYTAKKNTFKMANLKFFCNRSSGSYHTTNLDGSSQWRSQPFNSGWASIKNFLIIQKFPHTCNGLNNAKPWFCVDV